jgi:branched-chain amino acid transport system permease protein
VSDVQYLVNGIVQGSIYGLVAVGYTLIYGILGLVNFAFGGIFTFGALGALAGLTASGKDLGGRGGLLSGLGLPMWGAVLFGVVVGTGIGVVVERIAYRPLRGRSTLTLLVSSLTMLIMLQALAQTFFGAADMAFPPLVTGRAFGILGATVDWMDVVVIGIAGLMMLALWALVNRTPFGRAMRATAEDPDAAQLMGIDVRRVVTCAFALGSALAALSGVTYAAHFQFANATMGFVPGLKGLVAAVLGGIGNLPGAFLGGMVLGLIETVAAAFLPQGAAYRDAVAFLVLVVILWARPRGLLGVRVREQV